MKFDNEDWVIPSSNKPDVTAGKLEKKLSTMSTSSTVSIGSSGAREVSKAKGGRLNTNRSCMLFPHLINKKRKREDRLGGVESQGLNSSMAEFQARTKVARMDTKSPVKKVKRRLNSFSDPSDPPSFPAICKPSSSLETVNSQTSLKPFESTCLSGTVHLGLHHMAEQDFDLSSIQIRNMTPNKGQKTPMKKFQQAEDFFSLGKRVMFNMAPQPPPPKLGVAAKSDEEVIKPAAIKEAVAAKPAIAKKDSFADSSNEEEVKPVAAKKAVVTAKPAVALKEASDSSDEEEIKPATNNKSAAADTNLTASKKELSTGDLDSSDEEETKAALVMPETVPVKSIAANKDSSSDVSGYGEAKPEGTEKAAVPTKPVASKIKDVDVRIQRNNDQLNDLKMAHCNVNLTGNCSDSKKGRCDTDSEISPENQVAQAQTHEYFSDEEDLQLVSDGESDINYNENYTDVLDDLQIADDDYENEIAIDVHVEEKYKICRTKNMPNVETQYAGASMGDNSVYDFHSDESSLSSCDSEFEIADEFPLNQENESASRSNCCALKCRNRSLPVGCTEALDKITQMRKLDIKNELLGHLRGQQRMDLSTSRLFFGGDYMCDKYFSEISGVSLYIIGQVKEDYAAGRTRYEHGNAGSFQSSTATTGFQCWMKSFAELYGQSAPDEEVFILPSFLTMKDLFEIYENEVEEPRIQISTFYSLFKKHFAANRDDRTLPQIRLSAWSSHSKCDQCICLSRYRRTSRTEESLAHAKSLQLAHKTCYGRARSHIESLRHLALSYPDSRLFIQIDDMGRLYVYFLCTA